MGLDRQRQRQITKRFNSKHSSVRQMKNKVRLVGMAEEGSKTILHRVFTESIKKHTEDNKAHRKYRHSEGDGYSLKRGK